MLSVLLVLKVGFEPTRITPRDFKSRMSAYSITSTYLVSVEGLEPSRSKAVDFESTKSAIPSHRHITAAPCLFISHSPERTKVNT